MKVIKIAAVLSLVLLLLCACGETELPAEYDFVEVKEGHVPISPSTPWTKEQREIYNEVYKGFGVSNSQAPPEAWPDGFAWFECVNGFVVVYLSDYSVEMIERVQDMVSDPSYLRFVSAPYSYRELGAAYDEICDNWEELQEKFGVSFTALRPEKSHILIVVPQEQLDDAAEYFESLYGGMVELDAVPEE